MYDTVSSLIFHGLRFILKNLGGFSKIPPELISEMLQGFSWNGIPSDMSLCEKSAATHATSNDLVGMAKYRNLCRRHRSKNVIVKSQGIPAAPACAQ